MVVFILCFGLQLNLGFQKHTDLYICGQGILYHHSYQHVKACSRWLCFDNMACMLMWLIISHTKSLYMQHIALFFCLSDRFYSVFLSKVNKMLNFVHKNNNNDDMMTGIAQLCLTYTDVSICFFHCKNSNVYRSLSPFLPLCYGNCNGSYVIM